MTCLSRVCVLAYDKLLLSLYCPRNCFIIINQQSALILEIERFQITEMSELSKVPFMLLPCFSASIIFRSSFGCSSLHNQHLFFLWQKWQSVFLYCPWWNKSTANQPCFFKKKVECSSCICLQNNN